MKDDEQNARIWFEFESPFSKRFKDNGLTRKETTEMLLEQYNSMFRRIGWTFDPLWWHEGKSVYCFTIDEAGGFMELTSIEPGIWLTASYINKGQQAI